MSDTTQRVYIIDDDEAITDSMGMLFNSIDLPYQAFASGQHFLDQFDIGLRGCLVLDIRMPGMSGLELQKELANRCCSLPVIFITGHGDIPMAVEAMRAGALDFLRKPLREQELLDRVQQALSIEADDRARALQQAELISRVRELTEREHEIFKRVAKGQANKVIALELGVSQRTVEAHRAHVMQKLQVRTLAELVRAWIEST